MYLILNNSLIVESKDNIEDASLRRFVENVEAKTLTSGFNGEQYVQNFNSNMTGIRFIV